MLGEFLRYTVDGDAWWHPDAHLHAESWRPAILQMTFQADGASDAM